MKFNQLFNFDNLVEKLSMGLVVVMMLIGVVGLICVVINVFGFIVIPVVFISVIVMYIIGSILEKYNL